MHYLQELGLLVRRFREERGFTQSQLADEIGKTTKTISQIENGAVATSLETLFLISEVLDVPVSHFFRFAEAMEDESANRVRTIAKIAAQLSAVSDNRLELVRKLTAVVAEHEPETGKRSVRRRRAKR
jgi:transcriptional regulator with XRE-family HTH domain